MKFIEGNYGRHFLMFLETANSLPKDKKFKVLDIGAADRKLRKYLPANFEYYSLDYKDYLKEEKHDYLVNLNDGRIPIKNDSFDIVVCLETLEHTIYPNKVMKEILRIGKKDAIFIFSMPNEYNIWGRIQFLLGMNQKSKKPFKVTEEHGHIHVPRTKDIVTFFSEYLDIEKTDYVWQSRTVSKYLPFVDSFINLLAGIYPSLFSRVVIVQGKGK